MKTTHALVLVLGLLVLQAPSPAQPAPKSGAEKAFLALKQELLEKWQARRRMAGGSSRARRAAQIEQGRELIERWNAFLVEHKDSAFAFRARDFVAQGYILSENPKAAESQLVSMEKEARTVTEIAMVAMGFRHLRDAPEAGADVLDRYIARTRDTEKKAAAMLEKRTFVSAGRRSRRKALRLEISREVARMYPGTEAGRKAVIQVRAAELGPGKVPLELKAFKDLEGKAIDLKAYKGKVLLIDFWATWCGPCIRDLPDLLKTYKACHRDGFEILSISFDTDRKKLLTVLEEKGMTWRHYFDGLGPDNMIGRLYGVDTLPRVILIGKDGLVAAMNPKASTLLGRVQELLQKKTD